MQNIRNFLITAHIDHGKSTLADRMLEITGTIEKRQMQAQFLDQMDIERERGITIKMAPVRMIYHPHRRTTQTSTQNNAETEGEGLLYADLTYNIRGAAFEVRRRLGLGHKESIYHNALIEEFKKKNLKFESEKSIGIFYEGKKIGSYKPDFILENKILIELKALPEIGRPQTEQLWSYLKGSEYSLALFINFGSTDLDIKRVVYESARLQRDSALFPRSSAQVEEYILNLIDTPGHSDFAYEVSRALFAVEGAILLVDATQGIQAQTLANFHAARRANLKIIGAVSKIDMLQALTNADGTRKNAELEKVIHDTAKLIGCEPREIYRVSGKTGEGVKELLDAVINKLPPPKKPPEVGDKKAALIFDSFYDDHKGIVTHVRVFGGTFKRDDTVKLAAVNESLKVKEVGYFSPKLTTCDVVSEGEIGYVATGIKDPDKLKIGDTLGEVRLPGYKEPKPVVFVALYPNEESDYDDFKSALNRLRLNDASFNFEPDMSEVLGRGFRCGFLGRLHFEIIAERLKREFNMQTVSSFPSVSHKVKVKGEWKEVKTPKDFPVDYEAAMEPVVKIEIVTPAAYLGNIMQLQNIFHLKDLNAESFEDYVIITARLPLTDLISDFDDKLKSVSSGFASFSYELTGEEKADLTKLEILVAEEVVPGLTRVVRRDEAESEGRRMLTKLKDLLPKQQFTQALQARAFGRILARENISAMKKDVTGYLYGGDRTRKMKLWKKQQRGKKRLREAGTGRVNIEPSVFKELLKK